MLSFEKHPSILQSLLQMCKDPILLVDENLDIQDTNDALEGLLSENELKGKPFLSFLHEEDHEELRESVKTGEHPQSTFRARLISTEGCVSWLDWTVESNEEFILLIGKNITAHRQTLSELAALRRKGLERKKVEDLFLAKMNHEMRTPLNAIIGYSQILKRIKTLNEKQLNYIQSIRDNGDSLLKLVNNVLAVSQLLEGPISLTLEKVRVPKLIENVIEEFRITTEEKSIALVFEHPDQTIQSIEADASKLQHVIRNLIDNAVKFTDLGQILVEIRSDEKKLIAIDIVDSGRGIASEKHAIVFEPFEKGCAFDQDCGIGLGLSLAKQYCEQMGFELEISSQEKGTRFSILFL